MIGKASGTAEKHSTIENCSVTDVIFYFARKTKRLGGFVGQASYTDFTNCTATNVTITVTTYYQSIGGFVGNASTESTYTGCKVVNFTLNGDSTDYAGDVGGFTAYTSSSTDTPVKFTDCSVTDLDMNLACIDNNSWTAGGFIGYLSSNIDIDGCTVDGTIDVTGTGADHVTGSFVGTLDWTSNKEIAIDNSTSTVSGDFIGENSPYGVNSVIIDGVVAKIGETTYSSLQAAIDAASAGDTVTLVTNRFETGIKVPTGKAVVIDFSGFTLIGDILSEGNLTVKNGAVNSKTFTSAIESYGENAKLTVENMTVTSKRHALRIEGGEATIISGTFTATGRNEQEDTVHALNAGGEYTTTVTIKSGTFNGIKFGNNAETADSGAAVNAQNNATVTINGGKFGYGQNETLRVSGTGKIVVKGGEFDQDPTAYVADGYRAAEAAGVWTVAAIHYVAEVNGTNYETLQAAIDAANDGDTIALIVDIDLSGWTSVDIKKAITLDGNGKTITGLTSPLVNNSSADFEIKNLTVSDANIEVKSANGADNDTSAAALVQWANGGTLTLTNVSVLNSTISGDGYVAALVGFVDSTANGVIVNGGKISGNTLTAGGVVGTVSALTYADVTINNVEISGNTLTSNSDGGTRPDKVGIVVGRPVADTVSVSATVAGDNTAKTGENEILGTVIGSLSGGNAVITGGTYPVDPTVTGKEGQYTSVKEGFKIEKNDAGTYSVVPNYVAEVDGKEYTSLQAAINAAAANGKTVMVIDDFDENNIEVAAGTEVVIELDYHTVDVDIMNYGKLTVKFGTIKNTNADKSAIENNGADAELIVEDLTITSVRHAIRVDGGKAKIISGSYTTVGQATVYAVNISTGATVEIIDGTFKGAKETGTNENTAALRIRGNSTVTIANGNFSGGVLGTLQCDNTSLISITGGTFDEDPKAYVASGYAAVKNEDGLYDVVFAPITIAGKTLMYESIIQIKYVFTANVKDVTASDLGLEVWYSNVDFDNVASDKTYALSANGTYWEAITDGIPAKNMGDIQYVRAYVIMNGIKYYTEVLEYSPAIYAQNRYNQTTDANTKALVIALMNYGTAAQNYFSYNTNAPMNAFLNDSEKDCGFTNDMITQIGGVDTDKVSSDSNFFKKIQKNLEFEGAINILIRTQLADSNAINIENSKLLYWTASEYNENEKLDVTNATKQAKLEVNGVYLVGSIDSIAAKNLGDTGYYCIYIEDADGNGHYSELFAYSAHEYAKNKLNSTNENMIELAKAMVVYSNKAAIAMSAKNK